MSVSGSCDKGVVQPTPPGVALVEGAAPRGGGRPTQGVPSPVGFAQVLPSPVRSGLHATAWRACRQAGTLHPQAAASLLDAAPTCQTDCGPGLHSVGGRLPARTLPLRRQESPACPSGPELPTTWRPFGGCDSRCPSNIWSHSFPFPLLKRRGGCCVFIRPTPLKSAAQRPLAETCLV